MGTLLEQMMADVSSATTVTPPSVQSSATSVDSIDEQMNKQVRDMFKLDGTQTPPTGAQVYPEDKQPDVDVTDQLAFGFAQSMSGSSKSEVRSDIVNATKYLNVEHPELAARMGIGIKDKNVIPTDSYILNSLVAFAQAADTAIVSSVVSLFGSERQVQEWDAEVLERNFGEDYLDKTPDERRVYLDQQADARLKEDFPEFYDNPELQESGWVTLGNVGATLVSPTSLVGPAAMTYKTAAGIGAGWGAMDMALLDLADRGKIDPMHVAGGAVAGAIFAPVLKAGMQYGAKGTGQVFDIAARKLRYRTSTKILDKYEEIIAKRVVHGSSRGQARHTALGATGMDTKSINHMYTITGRERKLPKSVEEASDFMSDLEDRASWWSQNEAINGAKTTLNKWVTPIIDRMSELAPKIAHELRGVDHRTHLRTHSYFLTVKPWLSKFKKLGKADKIKIKKLLSVDSKDSFREAGLLMREMETSNPDVFKGFVKDWIAVRKVLSEVAGDYKAKGYDFDLVEHFFPRTAKFPKHMEAAHVGVFHKLVSEAAEKKGSPLTHEELGILMRNVSRRAKKDTTRVKSSSHLRQRTVDDVTDFLEPYYADPLESLHSYLRMASNDIERQAFFQKFGLTKKERFNIDKIDEAIPKDIKKLSKSLKGLDKYEVEQVSEMLRARFTSGESSPSRFWQNFKNLGYILTIFNPYSALTQFGDQAFAMYKYGIRNHMKAVFTPMHIRKSDLGLDDIMEELYGDTIATKRAMDFFAKWSGFTKIDTFGKDVILNAALLKYTKLAKTKAGAKEISQQWGRYFEEDTPKLVKDLLDGNITDNVRLLLWHELADVQPIALSEMPEKYLTMSGGRVLYMLKSFLLKQLSFVRRQIVGELKENNTTKGLTNLALFTGYWNLVGGGVDGIKNALVDSIAGTDTPMDMSDMMVENTLQMIGINKYQTAKMGKEGFVNSLYDFFMPPVPFVDDLTIAAYQARPEKAWRAVPYVGSVMNKVVQAKKKQKQRISRFTLDDGTRLSPREQRKRKRLQEFSFGQ